MPNANAVKTRRPRAARPPGTGDGPSTSVLEGEGAPKSPPAGMTSGPEAPRASDGATRDAVQCLLRCTEEILKALPNGAGAPLDGAWNEWQRAGLALGVPQGSPSVPLAPDAAPSVRPVE